MLRSFRRRSTCCDVFDRDVQRFVRVAGVSSPDDDGRHRDADLDLHLGIAARHEHDCESQGGAEAARGESRLCMVPHIPLTCLGCLAVKTRQYFIAIIL